MLLTGIRTSGGHVIRAAWRMARDMTPHLEVLKVEFAFSVSVVMYSLSKDFSPSAHCSGHRHLFVCLFVCLPVCLPVRLSDFLYLSTCVCLLVCLSVSSSVYLSVLMSACLFVCMSFPPCSYFHWFEKLSRVDARVAELVGVVPAYLVKLRQVGNHASSIPSTSSQAFAPLLPTSVDLQLQLLKASACPPPALDAWLVAPMP